MTVQFGSQCEPARDLIGYAGAPPHAHWPNGARLALSLVINYEEGGESTVCNGDELGETRLLEYSTLGQPPLGERLLAAESLYEYGSCVGIWRLFRLLTGRGLTATVWAVGRAVELNPLPIKAMAQQGFEIACHHYRWIDYQRIPPAIEREHLRQAIAIIDAAAGRRPVGFFHWCGSNTRKLLVEEGGFLYDSEAYNEELPYWVSVEGKPHLVIPYMLDNNDFRYAQPCGWGTGDDFFDYNKATFDQLYEEGARQPALMTLGLHARLSGRPGRARALARFLDYVLAHPDVWICTRRQIAEHWRRVHPPTTTS